MTATRGTNRPANKKGIFGAPKCRLTGITVALAALLIGIVFAGVGGAVAAFQWHEFFARVMAMLLVAVGVILMIISLFIFLQEQMCPRAQAYAYADEHLVNEAHQSESDHHDQSSTAKISQSSPAKQQTTTATPNINAETSFSQDAPPPYESLPDGRVVQRPAGNSNIGGPPQNQQRKPPSIPQGQFGPPKVHHQPQNPRPLVV